MTWLRLTIYGLATWRLAVLLSEDTGPFHFLSRLRSFLKREAKRNTLVKKSDVAKGVECIRCNSYWIGAPIAAYVFTRHYLPEWAVATCEAFLLWNALSAVAVLVNRALPPSRPRLWNQGKA